MKNQIRTPALIYIPIQQTHNFEVIEELIIEEQIITMERKLWSTDAKSTGP